MTSPRPFFAGGPVNVRNSILRILTNPSGGPAFVWETITDAQGNTYKWVEGVQTDVKTLTIDVFDGDLTVNQPGRTVEDILVNGRMSYPPQYTYGDETPVTFSGSLQVNSDSIHSNNELKPGHLGMSNSAIHPNILDEWKSTHYYGRCAIPQSWDVLLTFDQGCGPGGAKHLAFPWVTFAGQSLTIGTQSAQMPFNGTSHWPHAFLLT